jgi:hypothetical protein
MGLPPLHQRFSAWLALLAMLLGVFAPAVTQAVVAGSERAGWVQICSVSGMAWVQLDASDDGNPSGSNGASGCTWCTGHATGDLPPTPTVWVPAALVHTPPLQDFASAVLPRAWAPAQSRAPPLL